jgi:metal-responsive CopG/Arc/MetJ family transcriptional regulator
MQVSQSVGISIPVSLLKRIDSERGDISRSRFFLRMIEKSYDDYLNNSLQTVNKKNVRDTVDERTETLKSTVSPGP